MKYTIKMKLEVENIATCGYTPKKLEDIASQVQEFLDYLAVGFDKSQLEIKLDKIKQII